jgi:O-antigen/teichoic acid export membrane protein
VKALLGIFDQGIVRATSFATAVIIGRASSPDELGRYYLALTIVFVIVGVQEMIFSGPYTFLSARRRGQDLVEFTGSAWLLFGAVIGAAVLLLVGVLGAATLGGLISTDAKHYWVLLGVLPLLLLREGIRRFAFARLRMAIAIALDATVAVLQLAGLLALWYLGQLSVLNIFGVMGAACGLASVGYLVLNPPDVRFVRNRVFADWRENWSFGKWALLSFATVDTIPYIMPWVVNLAGGPAASGTFGACTTLIGITNVLQAGTGNFLKPKAAESFANEGAAGLYRVLMNTAWVFIVVYGSLCLLISVTGDKLVVLVFGSDFSGTGGVLLALAASGLVGSLGWIAVKGLWATNQLRASFIADVCMLIATLVATVTLVGRYGPLGAALANLVGMTVGGSLKIIILYLVLRSIQSNQDDCRLAAIDALT